MKRITVAKLLCFIISYALFWIGTWQIDIIGAGYIWSTPDHWREIAFGWGFSERAAWCLFITLIIVGFHATLLIWLLPKLRHHPINIRENPNEK